MFIHYTGFRLPFLRAFVFLFVLKAELYLIREMELISYIVIWTSTVPFDTNKLYIERLSRWCGIESRGSSKEWDSSGPATCQQWNAIAGNHFTASYGVYWILDTYF